MLTPHTYLLNAATTFTDTLFLNAEGNSNAVFVFKIKGALSTSTYSKVVLKNGALAKNVFWMVDGAVSINDYSIFKGTIICNNGAINLMTGVNMEGRALSTTGALNTSAIDISMPPGCGGSSSPLLILNITDQTVCAGNSVSFTVTATGTNPTYQWRKGATNLVDGGNISGSTTNTLTINPASINDTANNYNVVINGTFSPSATSTNATLTVNTAPKITIQPLNKSVCDAGTVSFTVVATGTNLTYQWRKGTQDLINGGNISGATTSVLKINPADISDASSNYNVIVTGICAPSDTSTNTILVVNTAPQIITEPISQAVCKGNSVSFSVNATGMNLTYQWRKGNVNIISSANISDATSDTLTINPVNFSDTASNYNVIISGTCFPNDTSINVSLKLNSTTILTQPTNQHVCVGGTANFAITSSGLALTYQWRKGNLNLVNGTHFSGATSPILTINSVSLTDTASNYNVLVYGACAPNDTSINVSLLINPATTIILNPANTIVCAGTSATFSVITTGTNLTYQWRKGNTDLNNGGNISGATTASLTINPATSLDSALDYNVVVTGLCQPNTTSANASLTVNPINSIISQPVFQTACVGSSINFFVTATGNALTYQWRKGNVNLVNGAHYSGATTSMLTISAISILDASSNYNVIVYGACAPNDTSINVSLLVNPATTITLNPANTLVCAGNSAAFSVTTTGASLTYQWRKGNTDLNNGGNISGATTATLTINPATSLDAASDYNVVVNGYCIPNATSTNATLVVNTVNSITTQPISQSACIGSSIIFSVTSTGTGLSYQWRKGTVNLINGGSVLGATSSVLIINPITLQDTASDYNVVVSGNCSVSETSINVSLLVNSAPAIILNPRDTVVCEGNLVNFSITAKGSNLQYQWRKGLTNITNGGSISGATTATLTINPATTSDVASDYNVVITGTCSPNVTSVNAKLVVNPKTYITNEPLNQTICSGNAASFTVAATGANLSYQWRKGLVNIVNTGNITGANTATLSFNAATILDTASNYNVVVSGTCTPNETSINVILSINPLTIITLEPTNQSICEGTSVSFIVTATGNGLTYQWRKGNTILNDGGNISGATTPTLTINPANISDAGSNYNLVINGACLPITTSNSASLAVYASVNITTQPINQTVCVGSSTSFYIAATGTNVTYQWRKGTQILSNGGNISGATSSVLTINPVSSTDASTDYNVVISGTCSTETSIHVSLFINETTTISSQPIPITICEGNSATFTVTASGSNNTYQWRKGTQNIINNGITTGANTNSLIISPATGLDSATNYNVIISGVCLPSVTSIDVALTVNPTPSAKANCNSPVCMDGSVFLYAQSFANATYQWTGTNGYSSRMQNPIFTSLAVEQSGTYSLIVSTPTCTSDTSSVILKIYNCVGLNIPEGFSPNGDGINDKFVIRGIDNFPNNSILIFNRWGDKIYEASPYINEWDGKPSMGIRDNGNLLPSATYFYLLNLGDNSEIIKGTIYLNK